MIESICALVIWFRVNTLKEKQETFDVWSYISVIWHRLKESWVTDLLYGDEPFRNKELGFKKLDLFIGGFILVGTV